MESTPKRTVTFTMCWSASGRQTIDLPDDIDANDFKAVEDYIRSKWSEIPLPAEGTYHQDSDELDPENIYVYDPTAGDSAEKAVLSKLMADNDENLKTADNGYDRGYAEGYHDALVDGIKGLGIETDEEYYN